MNALEVSHVTKRQGKFALEDVSLALPQGCILGLVGENGAGKTTLIRLLLGLCRADQGQVRLLDADSESPQFLQAKAQTGVALDEAAFPPQFHLAQVDKTFSGIYPNWRSADFFQLCRRFALAPDKPFKAYSRGMKMKLSLATALSHQARLLILDEPTSGLDPMVRDEILDLLMEFTREETHSVLISSHIVSDIEKLSDYVAFLHQGRLAFCAEKEALEEDYALAMLTFQQYENLDKAAVVGARRDKYQVRALLRRALAPDGIPLDRAALEDIMLLMAKGEES
ncbi:MAG TPA: ABC transporter ATP-binding protein [Candidatus Excrementavichristensenella intestinipullorum]|nr:ABC transporter ATP-binding protein [Candidatus Excrementavichristensenella intestinipullorum]